MYPVSHTASFEFPDWAGKQPSKLPPGVGEPWIDLPIELPGPQGDGFHPSPIIEFPWPDELPGQIKLPIGVPEFPAPAELPSGVPAIPVELPYYDYSPDGNIPEIPFHIYGA